MGCSATAAFETALPLKRRVLTSSACWVRRSSSQCWSWAEGHKRREWYIAQGYVERTHTQHTTYGINTRWRHAAATEINNNIQQQQPCSCHKVWPDSFTRIMKKTTKQGCSHGRKLVRYPVNELTVMLWYLSALSHSIYYYRVMNYSTNCARLLTQGNFSSS